MTRRRQAFACCNPHCTEAWFENTVELSDLYSDRIVECPFCHARCYVNLAPSQPRETLRGGGELAGEPSPRELPERIPTRPVEA